MRLPSIPARPPPAPSAVTAASPCLRAGSSTPIAAWTSPQPLHAGGTAGWGTAMTTEIRAMMRACWTSRMPRTPLPVSLCEFVALAGELGLAWPQGQRPHPVIGFSEVTLTEQTLADYADTLAYLGAAIRLYRDTFRRLGLLGGQGQGEGQEGQDGDGQQPTGKTGERFKVACGCQPPRSFWIRAKQYTPGPISCGVCGQDFQPQDTA